MPAYDYHCIECGMVWEELRPSDRRDAEAICPECNIPGLRIYTGSPIIPWFPDTTRSFYKDKRKRPPV